MSSARTPDVEARAVDDTTLISGLTCLITCLGFRGGGDLRFFAGGCSASSSEELELDALSSSNSTPDGRTYVSLFNEFNTDFTGLS